MESIKFAEPPKVSTPDPRPKGIFQLLGVKKEMVQSAFKKHAISSGKLIWNKFVNQNELVQKRRYFYEEI